MQVVILCGGKGTRLQERTQYIPKVLVEIGGKPILWHIMRGYASYGYTDFVLCLGHLGEKVRDFFRNGDKALSEAPVETIHYTAPSGQPWQITFVDTGAETQTGGRIFRVAPFVQGEPFFATYGDGVADLDLRALLDFHCRHGRIATLTAVQPVSQFGLLDIGGQGEIIAFREKPRLHEWVNGGFFVFNRGIFDYLDEGCILERAPFERLARDGQIIAYRHGGFWACMDTYKDTIVLDSLWQAGQAPWKTWED